MKESAFSKLLKPHLPGDVSRIESGSTECGIPDISGTWDGIDYWVENKKCDNKKSLRNVLSLLEPEQKVWHLKRVKQGARIFVCVKYCFGIAVYRVRETVCLTEAGYARIAMCLTYKGVAEAIKESLKSV